MTLIQCPRCNRIFPVQPGAGNQDFEHECDSGNDTLDQEDVFDITNVNWNLMGQSNRASVTARVHGANIDDVTPRGNRESTHITRQHFEFIELGDNFVIKGGN